MPPSLPPSPPRAPRTAAQNSRFAVDERGRAALAAVARRARKTRRTCATSSARTRRAGGPWPRGSLRALPTWRRSTLAAVRRRVAAATKRVADVFEVEELLLGVVDQLLAHRRREHDDRAEQRRPVRKVGESGLHHSGGRKGVQAGGRGRTWLRRGRGRRGAALRAAGGDPVEALLLEPAPVLT
eukprot:CAMPEP_0185474122 /NCGR_PEP_ID=MMETSP1366-20130426/1863_1 /TAXON_ID=38817 /ORGANISM="Gephyrocapsa oceanica, Strain RCC1303" /LENGTH=183 /DNA_ID=CAMNT_0028081009 /DNA_START=231 /DNA_END=783 /DNA_ORIENTATION=+